MRPLNEKAFPQLGNKSVINSMQNLLKSDNFIDLLTQSITKIITMKSIENKPISSNNIKNLLMETFSSKNSCNGIFKVFFVIDIYYPNFYLNIIFTLQSYAKLGYNQNIM